VYARQRNVGGVGGLGVERKSEDEWRYLSLGRTLTNRKVVGSRPDEVTGFYL
jgi:hypothetical protein